MTPTAARMVSRVASRHLARLDATQDQEQVVVQSLATLLGLLRAQYFSYQTSHWQVGGTAAYGNHLLFQRFYEGVQGQVDELAEKMVGYHDVAVVEPARSAKIMLAWVEEWAKVECPFCRGLASEKDLQRVVQQAYDAIKGAGVLTLGLDDWLMALANTHETNTYLLQQVENQKAPGSVAHP
jgi:DNA-binding ferritin-like protein